MPLARALLRVTVPLGVTDRSVPTEVVSGASVSSATASVWGPSGVVHE